MWHLMWHLLSTRGSARLTPLFVDDEGATAVEYGVMVALVVAIIIVLVTSIGQKLVPGFEAVNAGF